MGAWCSHNGQFRNWLAKMDTQSVVAHFGRKIDPLPRYGAPPLSALVLYFVCQSKLTQKPVGHVTLPGGGGHTRSTFINNWLTVVWNYLFKTTGNGCLFLSWRDHFAIRKRKCPHIKLSNLDFILRTDKAFSFISRTVVPPPARVLFWAQKSRGVMVCDRGDCVRLSKLKYWGKVFWK